MGELMRLMNGDPDDFNAKDRIEWRAKEILKDKNKMTAFASEYNSKYSDEIDAGTEELKLLLEETATTGNVRRDGERLKEKLGRFVPSVHTPILNWLFFYNKECADEKLEEKRVKLDEQHGHEIHSDFAFDNVQEPKDMVSYILGNTTLDTFNKIKKLKALATGNPNVHESNQAETVCKRLCEKYDLDYDRIPVNNG